MEKYKAPEIQDISSSLSLEDTIKSVADSALKGLEYYVKLKGAENRANVDNAFKLLGTTVKGLDWTTSTDEDFESAFNAVNSIVTDENLKGLSKNSKETMITAAEIYRAKIEKEQALRAEADKAEVELNGYLDELDALGNTVLGESQYDTNEALELLDKIKIVKENNIGVISEHLNTKALTEIRQAEEELDTRTLLQSIDIDNSTEGIQVKIEEAKALQESLNTLGLVADKEKVYDSAGIFQGYEIKGPHDWDVTAQGEKYTSFYTERTWGDEAIALEDNEEEYNKRKAMGQVGESYFTVDEITKESHAKYFTIKGTNGKYFTIDSDRMEGSNIKVGDELGVEYDSVADLDENFPASIYTAYNWGHGNAFPEMHKAPLETWNIDLAEAQYDNAIDALNAYSVAKTKGQKLSVEVSANDGMALVARGVSAGGLGVTNDIDYQLAESITFLYFGKSSVHDIRSNYGDEIADASQAYLESIEYEILSGNKDMLEDMTKAYTDMYSDAALKAQASMSPSPFFKGGGAQEYEEQTNELIRVVKDMNLGFKSEDRISISSDAKKLDIYAQDEIKRDLLYKAKSLVESSTSGWNAETQSNDLHYLIEAMESGNYTGAMINGSFESGAFEKANEIYNKFYDSSGARINWDEVDRIFDTPREKEQFYDILRAFKVATDLNNNGLLSDPQ